MAIALAACTGDELQQIAPLQKPVGERVISVDAYTPSDDAHTRLDFTEEDDGSLSLAWTEEEVMNNLDSIFKKQRHYFANKGPSSQGYGFSYGHVWM